MTLKIYAEVIYEEDISTTTGRKSVELNWIRTKQAIVRSKSRC